nr:phosphoribosylformylglycinamidine cyclo-ligase, chloroplastic/mitochondrial [Ipomoea batatas]
MCNNQINSSEDKVGGLTYKDAGVDIDAGSELVRRIAKMTPGIGGFGGLFPLGDSYLVAGTDGVGTKLKLAFETGIHDTIGIDLVAMSVNDIVTSGAKPLFFLDYFATSKLDVDLAEKVIKGIVDGCKQSDCALLGGETAEMPDFYANGEYDLSGFAVGIVKKDSVIDGKNIVPGDVLIGLPSSGVHSNGFSLVRRVITQSGLSMKDQLPGSPITLGEALMAPTVIYVKQVLDIISKGGVKGVAHITGGGFTDNIPRVFPKGLGAIIHNDSWVVPPVFKWIQEAGKIEDAEMRRTFNMGIGMVLVVTPDAALRILGDGCESSKAFCIGEVVKGDGVSYH